MKRMDLGVFGTEAFICNKYSRKHDKKLCLEVQKMQKSQKQGSKTKVI